MGSRISNPDDRADAVQDTFLKAWHRLDTLRDDEQFLPWLYAIARNAATTIGRGNARRPTVDIDDPTTPTVASNDVAVADVIEAVDLLSPTKEAMVLLSHRDATVLTMVSQLGFGLADIAAALGITENNAGVVLHRARQRLRAQLELHGVNLDGRESADDR